MPEVINLPAIEDATRSGGAYDVAVTEERRTVGGRVKSGGLSLIKIIAVGFAGLMFISSCFWGVLFLSMDDAAMALVGIVVAGIGISFSSGLAYWVWRGADRGQKAETLFPNIREANQAVTIGEVPLQELVDGLRAREPSRREQGLFTQALESMNSREGLFFDGWYMVPNSLPFSMTLGSYLFISREALDNNDFPLILAHELGHLNNGDSFVKASVWSLGKGLFGEQRITLFGSIADEDQDGEYNPTDLVRMGVDVAGRDWGGLLVDAAGTVIKSTVMSNGKGVQRSLDDLQVYFRKWDIAADSVALNYVDQHDYLRWLDGLARFQNVAGTPAFDESAELRLDRAQAMVDDMDYE